MGFVNYLLLGVLSLGLGWALRIYVLAKSPQLQEYKDKGIKHPTILKYLAVFFAVMMVVSWMIGRFVLNHSPADILFILVNSVVATYIFSFGLSPEHSDYEVPD